MDKYTMFGVLVHKKRGQVGKFCELSTKNVDNLKIFNSLIIICGISSKIEYIIMEIKWIARFKGIEIDPFKPMWYTLDKERQDGKVLYVCRW